MKKVLNVIVFALCMILSMFKEVNAQAIEGRYRLEIYDISDIKGINGKYRMNVAAVVTDLKTGNILTTGANILLDFYSYDSFYYTTCREFSQRYFELRQNPLNNPKARFLIEGQGSLYLGEKARAGRAELYQWSSNDTFLTCQLKN